MADTNKKVLPLSQVQLIAKEIAKQLQSTSLADNTTYTFGFDPENDHVLIATPSDGSTPIRITIPDNNTTYDEATDQAAGLMSAADHKKLAGVEENATHVIVDDALSDTSTNAVQNKAVKAGLDTKVDNAKVGVANGVASLNEKGQVPAAQLPSYVDDVIEGYMDGGKFYATKGDDDTLSDEIEPETGKIYVDLTTEKTYRWSGTIYAEISKSLALGETASTAFRGDLGKAAYDHISKKDNPHGVTKEQVGLGNVANLDQSKAIVSITRKGTTFTATALDGTTFNFDQQDDDTKYDVFTGATAEAAGTSGLVSAPAAGAQDKFLKGDGTWDTPKDTTYGPASSTSDGLMSKEDKAKLDGIDEATDEEIIAAVDAGVAEAFTA